nr:hypothetical protein CFP56_76829 [Quercus suber]
MDLNRRQQRDGKDKEQETNGKKALVGEIRMIAGRLVASRSSKSLKKAYAREMNSFHSRYFSAKTPRSSKLDIFSERDIHNVRQPYDDPLVIMLKIEEFNIHQVLIDNGSLVDIVNLPAHQQKKLDKGSSLRASLS